MSRFDRFGGKAKGLVPLKTGSEVQAKSAGARDVIERARSAGESAAASRILKRGRARVAIALDATGSMSGLIDAARESIAEILRRASAEAGIPVEVQLLAYRDYDVPNNVLEASEASVDPEALIGWLRHVEPMGGGANSGEAVEAALQAVENGEFCVVLVAGDEPSNSRANLSAAGRPQAPTAAELAAKLRSAGTDVHTFVVGGDQRAAEDFRKLAKAGGGQSGRLDGSREMIDLAVMAILSALKGAGGVRDYMSRHELLPNANDYAQLLIGSSGK